MGQKNVKEYVEGLRVVLEEEKTGQIWCYMGIFRYLKIFSDTFWQDLWKITHSHYSALRKLNT